MKIAYLGNDNLSCKGIYYILESCFPEDQVLFSTIKNAHIPLNKEYCDVVIVDCEGIDSCLDEVIGCFRDTEVPLLALAAHENFLKQLHQEIPGLRGMVNRNGHADFFIKAINVVMDGGYCYSWSVFGSFNGIRCGLNDKMYEKAGLTRREREILELCLAGETNKAISIKLSRSEKTISAHKYNILRKLGMKGWQLKIR